MLGARGLRSPASRRPWCVRFLGGRALHSAVRRGVRMSNAGGDDLYGLLGVDRHASADDLKRAYRQIPVWGDHLRFSVIAVYHPELGCWVFAILYGLCFGAMASVLQFKFDL